MITLFKSLLLPPAINIFIACFGALLLKRWSRLGKALLLFALITLYLFSINPFSKVLSLGLEIYPALPEIIVPKGEQAIVVLGGGRYTDAPEYAADMLNARALERLHYAVFLNRKTGLPILVSGGRLQHETLSEAELMKLVLNRDFNMQPRWLETQSRNTAENAFNSTQVLKADRINKAYLVTHTAHMRRAVWVFQQAGLEVSPAPTVFTSSSLHEHPVRWFIPNTNALSSSSFAIHEYLGIIWYWFRYRFV